MRLRSSCAGLVLLVLLPSTVRGQVAGPEFRVNTHTTGIQSYPAVASDANGNFVVVWQGLGEDGSNYAVIGQRFNASGVRQGGEFRVNTYTTSYQSAPAVASDPNGNFVVVWQSFDQEGAPSAGVFGRRYDAAGVAQGGEFQVNSFTTTPQFQPAVASDAAGNFVVVWDSINQDGWSYGIFGQRFNASGVRQGSEFRVNSYTTMGQRDPAVASDANGNFVVVWDSISPSGTYEIFGQRFSSSGVPLGSEFQVNSYTPGNQFQPSLSTDANGNFVVVWSSRDQDGSFYGVFGQRFSSGGVPQGAEFRVNATTVDDQVHPRVTSDENGNFVVVWTDYALDGSLRGVFGRRFNASGFTRGGEFRVNSYTTGNQQRPAIASNPDGDFVVVWQSYGQDEPISDGIFGQRYGDLIFEDGFESGDLSRWSSASTGGGDLLVSGAAALAGTPAGLLAFVNDTTSLYVQHDTPASFSRYRARLYFDPNGFDPGEASSHFRVRIFLAQDASNQRLVTIVLKRQGGQYSVAARARLNDGTRVDTAFFNITNAQHFVEFDWQRATGPGTSDGYLGLLIDGTTVAVLTALDNDLSPVSFVRMGAIAVKTGAAGTLYFDQFESRRLNLIGAE
jgi:hypothetical protein